MTSSYALIAEPDSRLANTFEQLAREAQLEAVVARDGVAAQRVLRERGAPALLVTNLVLPQLDGFALLADFRKKVPVSQTPVVVVSSSMQLRTTASGLRQQLGIREVVASGMVFASLRAALQRALSPSRVSQSNERSSMPSRATEVRPTLAARDGMNSGASARDRVPESTPTEEDEVWPTLPPRDNTPSAGTARAKQKTGNFAVPPVLPPRGSAARPSEDASGPPSLPARASEVRPTRDSEGRPSLPTREGRPQQTTQGRDTRPAQLTQTGANRPTQLTQTGANRPAQLTQTGANRPAQLTQTGANRPAQLTQTGANRPVQSTQGRDASARGTGSVAQTRPDARVPPRRTFDPQRLSLLDSMGLVYDSGPEQALQRLVEETARSLGVPIALISLVLEKQQWFKAHVGLTDELLQKRSTPLDQSFCRHVVDDDEATPLIVPDAKKHPYFAQNLLVRRGDVGSYAGAPLLTANGQVLGTLCILDKRPRAIGQDQVEQLSALARRVVGELELRTLQAEASASRAGQVIAAPDGGTASLPAQYMEAVLAPLEAGVMLMDLERKITYANPALCALVGLEKGELTGWTHLSLMHRLAALSEFPDDLLRRVKLHPEGPFVVRTELTLDVPSHRVLRYIARPVRLPHGIAQLGVCTDVSAELAHRALHEAPVMFVDENEGRA